MHLDDSHFVGVAPILHVVVGLAVLGFLTAALGPTVVHGQASDSLIVTSDDVRATLTEGCSFFRSYRARLDEDATPEDSTQFEKKVRQLMRQVREGGPYDLTPFSFTPANSGVTYTRPISALSAVPGADSARRLGAKYVSVGRSDEGSRWLSYVDVNEDGWYSYGRFSSARSREPDLYERPRRSLAFPLRIGTSWETEEQYGPSTQHQVVGSGRLITPNRKVASLVVTDRRERSDRDSASPDEVWFVDDDGNTTARLVEWGEVHVISHTRQTTIKTDPPPEGFTTHCAYPGDVPVSFPIPDEWTLGSLYTMRDGRSPVVLVRDPAALEESSSQRTRSAIGLRTPENVWIWLSAHGREDRPKEYLEVLGQTFISDAEVIQPASRRAIQGRTAYEKVWRGTGGEDRPLRLRSIAFRDADHLIEVLVVQPSDMPGDAETALQVFLDHLTVGM